MLRDILKRMVKAGWQKLVTCYRWGVGPKLVSFEDCPLKIDSFSITQERGTLIHTSQQATPRTLHLPYSPKSAVLLNNVAVWPRLGLIGESSKRVFRESYDSAYFVERIIRERRISEQKSITIDGVCCCVDADYLWSNYYHLNIDNAPKLYGLYRAAAFRDEEITLLVSDKTSKLARKIYQILLPDNVRLFEIPKTVDCVRVGSYLHLPRLSEGYGNASLPKECIDWYRNKISDSTGVPFFGGDELVYISRAKANKRLYANESELQALVKQEGFRVWFLEDLTFEEQVTLFSKARCIFGRHGAGLTNMLFATQCSVLEHCDGNLRRNYYRSLAAALGHDYANIAALSQDRDDNLIAPLDKIKSVLLNLLR